MVNGYATHGIVKQTVRDMGKTGAFALVFFYALAVGVGVGVVKTWQFSRYLYIC